MKTSPHSNLPAIRACIFDMDGLLIDSEDLYTLCTNEILREYGKPDLPWNIKAQLQGRPSLEVCKGSQLRVHKGTCQFSPCLGESDTP